jgi:hypothetical protein
VDPKQTETAPETQTTAAKELAAPFFARKLGRPALEVQSGVRAGVASSEGRKKIG